MAEEELDRSEEATPFKKEEARKKGTVARSQDMAAAVAVSGLLLTMVFSGRHMVEEAQELFRSLLRASLDLNDATLAMGVLAAALMQAIRILTPLWLVLIAFAVLSNMAQVGVKISFEPLKPDWKKLNPIQGFKRIFSLKMVFEGVKTLLKFVFFVLVVYWAILGVWPKLLSLSWANAPQFAQGMGVGAQQVITRMLAILLVIAAIDWLYVRRDMGKKLRMSRREVKDESKRREGDPRIKNKLRELRMQLMQKTQSVGKVKDADVLIVNPQHLAIAVKYERVDMMAPVVLAKGSGEMALKMKEIARRSGIPILENKPLARALFRDVKIDEWVPESHYAAVAKALIWAFRIRSGGADKGVA